MASIVRWTSWYSLLFHHWQCRVQALLSRTPRSQQNWRTIRSAIAVAVAGFEIKGREGGTTPYNTAIFYDVENLVEGYGGRKSMVDNLSFTRLLGSIRSETGNKVVGQIAVQRAFADWDNSRLSVLQDEINQLRIERVPVFGYSGGGRKKNAAEHDLVIDAMKFLFQQPHIQVFVIVSGDGGFCSLANTLHQFGKTVVGCAYSNCTSEDFRVACDYFVSLPNEGTIDRMLQNRLNVIGSVPIHNATFQSDVTPATCILSKVQITLERCLRFLKSGTAGSKKGIHLPEVYSWICDTMPGFRPKDHGFSTFAEFMQYACKDSELCVVHILPSRLVVALRVSPPEGGHVLPDMKARDVPHGFSALSTAHVFVDKRNEQMIAHVKIIAADTSSTRSEKLAILAKTREVMNWYLQDVERHAELVRSCIELEIVRIAVGYVAPGFTPVLFGFAKFSEYMRYACKDTEFCVVRNGILPMGLALRRQPPVGTTVLPDLELREIHCAETYRSILSTGRPVLRWSTAPEQTSAIVNWLLRDRLNQVPLATAVEKATVDLRHIISSADVIRETLVTFRAIGLFTEERVEPAYRLSLLSTLLTPQDIMNNLKEAAHQKLSDVVGKVDAEVLDGLLLLEAATADKHSTE